MTLGPAKPTRSFPQHLVPSSSVLFLVLCLVKKYFLPKYTLKIMYSSLISPHFNNNMLLWSFSIHRLIKLQKRAIRIIRDSKHNSHTEPLLKSFNILKLNDIFTIQCLTFFHDDCINVRVPVFFPVVFRRKCNVGLPWLRN